MCCHVKICVAGECEDWGTANVLRMGARELTSDGQSASSFSLAAKLSCLGERQNADLL